MDSSAISLIQISANFHTHHSRDRLQLLSSCYDLLFKLYTGWSFNLVPSLYGMAVLLHAKVTTLQFIFKNGHNLGSDFHFLMKLSGFLNYG